MKNVSVRGDGRQVQPTPPVQTKSTEQPEGAAGFVLAIRPELCHPNRKFKVIWRFLRAFHEYYLASATYTLLTIFHSPPSFNNET